MAAAAAAAAAEKHVEDDGKEKTEGIKLEGRGCTDVFCCVLFVLFWIGMLVVASIAFANGDAKRLLYGTDYNGNTCGDPEVGLDGKFRIVYPRTNEDLLLNMQGGKMNFANMNPLDFKFYGICVEKCPLSREVVCNYGITENIGAWVDADTAEEKNTVLANCWGNDDPDYCQSVLDNCWVSPADQASTMYRCVPKYVVVDHADQPKCLFPENWDEENPGKNPVSSDGLSVTGCLIVNITSQKDTVKPAQPNILFDKINSAQALWGRWFGDLQRAWWVVLLGGVVVALVVSFLYLIFLKNCTGCMVWTAIILTILLSFVITIFLYAKAGILTPELAQSVLDQAGITAVSAEKEFPQRAVASADNKDKFKYAAWVFTALSIILVVVTIAVRKQIKDAIRIIKKASEAMKSRPWVVAYPLVTVAMLVALLAWWVYVAAAMASAGEITSTDASAKIKANLEAVNDASVFQVNLTRLENQPDLKEVKPMAITRYLLAYHFFGLLWTNQVIQGIGMMTIAGTIAAWYFAQGAGAMAIEEEAAGEEGEEGEEGAKKKKSRTPVFDSWKRTVRYHLGSIAFGGLLIALLQFARAVLKYVERQMKQQGQDSRMVKMAMCVMQSCLWCLQKCVEVVTRNAFIIIAIKGTSFCSAAIQVIKTIATYPALMATVNTIGEIIMFLARAFVTCFCGLVAFGIVDNYPDFQEGGDDELSGRFLVVLFTMIFAFFTAAGFFYVFDIAVDTILICFITDKAEHDGEAVHMNEAEVFNKKSVKAAELTELASDDGAGEVDQV